MFDLSNFYNDYSTNPQAYQDLFKIYNDLAGIITDYVKQVDRNNVISSVETYRNIPIQYVRIDDATYDIPNIFDNSVYLRQKYNVLQPLTADTKQAFWDSLTNDQKIDVLDTVGKYIMLTVKRNDALDKPVPQIVDFELYSDKGVKLIRNYDYVLSNNKVYLINIEISSPAENVKFCFKNISIDLSTPQKLLGERVKINYNDILTKNEYREISQMLMYGALGGPTIKNMESALSSIIQLSDVKIYDKYNADVLRAGYWDNNDKDKLTDFDFLISLPNEFINDSQKLELFINYLNIIKPSYTNFIVSLLYPFKDTLDLKHKESNIKILKGGGMLDKLLRKVDTNTRKATNATTEKLFEQRKAKWNNLASAITTQSIWFDSGNTISIYNRDVMDFDQILAMKDLLSIKSKDLAVFIAHTTAMKDTLSRKVDTNNTRKAINTYKDTVRKVETNTRKMTKSDFYDKGRKVDTPTGKSIFATKDNITTKKDAWTQKIAKAILESLTNKKDTNTRTAKNTFKDNVRKYDLMGTINLRKSDFFDKIIGREDPARKMKTTNFDNIENHGTIFMTDDSNLFDAQIPYDWSTEDLRALPLEVMFDKVNIKVY